MGASEVKEITVFVICTKSKQIFVLKQYLVLTLHCLHAPLYSQIHSHSYTLIHSYTQPHADRQQATVFFNVFCLSSPVQCGSLPFSLPLSLSFHLSLLSIDCRQSTVLSVDIRCLFAAAAGHNEKHELYKQNKQSKHTFEEPPPAAPLAMPRQLMRFCRVQRG